jgi:hypothetical protein
VDYLAVIAMAKELGYRRAADLHLDCSAAAFDLGHFASTAG